MTAMSTWDNAPTLLLWSQNVEPPVLVRLEYLGYCGVLGMLKIWFSFLVPEAGLIKAALPPPLLVAAQPPSLRSCAHFAPMVAKCRTSGSRPARMSGTL